MTAAPNVKHSQESREAARSVEPHLSKLQAIVLFAIRRYGPLTDNQLIERVGLNPSTVRPRRVELERAGLIRPVAKVVQTNGRKALTWAAV